MISMGYKAFFREKRVFALFCANFIKVIWAVFIAGLGETLTANRGEKEG